MQKTPRVQSVPIESLTPTAKGRNPRTRDAWAEEVLDSSLAEYGAARSIVVDGKGVVRAGNGTLKAARAAGITKALVVETDGTELVVVKRPNWDERTAERYGIADNQSALLATYDNQILATVLKGLGGADQDLKALGFRDYEVSPLLEADWTPPVASGDLEDILAGRKTVAFTAEQWEVVTAALDKVGTGKVADRLVQICQVWLDDRG